MQKLFTGNNSDIPKLRFNGFSDLWKNKKLEDLATLYNGRAYKQQELLENGKYKVVRVGNFYTDNRWYYSNMELEDNKYIENGDLVYTWSATFGPHIWQGDKSIFHYHIWKVGINKKETTKLFMLQLLKMQFSKMSTNGGTMAHITKGDMEQQENKIPTLEEQSKIAALFTNLDKQLELSNDKLDSLKHLKKAYLQKMFI